MASAAAGPHVNVCVGFAGQRERHVAVDRGDRRRNPDEGVCDPATDGEGRASGVGIVVSGFALAMEEGFRPRLCLFRSRSLVVVMTLGRNVSARG